MSPAGTGGPTPVHPTPVHVARVLERTMSTVPYVRPLAGTGGEPEPPVELAAASEPLVSVIIPALNEARNLPHVMARLPEVDEVILVDGGSTDDTVDVACRLMPGIRVVRQNRRGKGNALACGFAARDRRHPGHDRRRRVDRPGRDPGLRRGAAGGRRLRQGLAVHRQRRQRRHHPAAPARQPLPERAGQRRCSAPATPTSATATTPSGRTAWTRSIWTAPRRRRAAGTAGCGATASRSRPC